MSNQKKKGLTLAKKHNLTGWAFLLPATLLIGWMSFYPMIRAFILSLQTGMGVNLSFNGFANYARILKDPTFKQTLFNTFFYLIVQVPIMLVLALMFASMLNNKDLRFKGLFRTCIFLPCATSLVSYAMIFRSLFANDGFINMVLRSLGMSPIMWFGNAWTARAVIIIALVWRWTGYNMVFYPSGLQNIEYSVYEAAKIDGASKLKQITAITLPLLRPTIIIMTLMAIGRVFYSDFGLFYQVPMNAGTLFSTTQTIDTYVYRGLMEQGNVGMSSAAGVYQSLVGFALVMIANFIVRKKDPENALF